MARQPRHALAMFVKAQLLLAAGEDEQAQQLLELAAAAEPPEPKVLKALGKLHYDAGRLDGTCYLVTDFVEGATLVGWRLTQLPRSQALEFLLASPLRPGRVLLAEALVGLAQLGLVTLSGLPVLAA